MNSTVSILGLYNADNTIFDNMSIPAEINRETLINAILLKCSALETLYTDPSFMKEALRIWSAYRNTVWEALYKTTQFDYNPIWNKDGTYTETEKRSNTQQASGSGTATQSVKAFNAGDWTGHTKAEQESAAASEGTEDITRERKEQGNIGVTTTQQMIREEREIREFNTIEYIIDDFQYEFCIMIY